MARYAARISIATTARIMGIPPNTASTVLVQ
jgi:hypothetical protein